MTGEDDPGCSRLALEESLEQDRRLREAIEGPYERYLREFHDSPMQRSLRDIAESPAERAARELEGPAERMLRELAVDAGIIEQARALTPGFLELEAATQSIQRLLGEDTVSAVARAVELAPKWQTEPPRLFRRLWAAGVLHDLRLDLRGGAIRVRVSRPAASLDEGCNAAV